MDILDYFLGCLLVALLLLIITYLPILTFQESSSAIITNYAPVGGAPVTTNVSSVNSKYASGSIVIPEPTWITIVNQVLDWNKPKCLDNYADCKTWAENGECTINPEYMYFACKNSCSTCNMPRDKKLSDIQYWNSKAPAKCIYRGEQYPEYKNIVSMINSH